MLAKCTRETQFIQNMRALNTLRVHFDSPETISPVIQTHKQLVKIRREK
jgi:hypothetical protein